MDFFACIKAAGELLKSQKRDSHIRVVSHLDTDGLTSCAILVSLLKRMGFHYSATVVQELEMDFDGSDLVIFADIGASKQDKIACHCKKAIILDHHYPEGSLHQGIIHVNPHLFGTDRNISGAGISLLFAMECEKEMSSLAHLGVIGAIGDSQGFSGLNQDILRIATENGRIRVERTIKFFGAQRKPIGKLLESGITQFIPGISADPRGAESFFRSMNIAPEKTLSDLSREEIEILKKALAEKLPEDEIIGDVYILPFQEEGLFRDAREFSTVLNACGRLGKPSVGIGACLNDRAMKVKAEKILGDYRKEIIAALKWFEGAKDKIERDGYMIVNSRSEILPTMVGTFASILSHSRWVKEGKIILSMGYKDSAIKVSMRVSGKNHRFDLKEIMASIVEKTGGEAGGHKNAAGAIIPIEKEKEFIEWSTQVLDKITIEEFI